MEKFGKDETFAIWEDDVLKTAKWFSYFDDFQKLPSQLQLDIVKKEWLVWSGLEKLAALGKTRRQMMYEDFAFVLHVDNELVAFKKTIEVDISWCSNYKLEQLDFFDCNFKERHEQLVQQIVALNPTDEELSFMLCYLSFQHYMKHCPKHNVEIVEQLQDSISNHLHEYYLNHMSRPNYSGRIAAIMKLINAIQLFLLHDKTKMELMKVFKVCFAKYSHPELFFEYE